MRRCNVFIRPSLSLSACFGVGSPRIRWRLWLAAPNELTLIHVPVLGFDFKASQRTRAWTGLGHMLQLQLRRGFFSPPAKGKSENNCEELWEKEISVHSPSSSPPLRAGTTLTSWWQRWESETCRGRATIKKSEKKRPKCNWEPCQVQSEGRERGEGGRRARNLILMANEGGNK